MLRRLDFVHFCGKDNETLLHAVIECDHAKNFWKAERDHIDLKMPSLTWFI
jgi:hypothetical protein